MENVLIVEFQPLTKYRIGVCSFIGDREEQQDYACICTDNNSLLAVVCDGMGGCSNGKAASAAVVKTMYDCYKAYTSSQVDQPAHFLRAAASQGNKLVAQILDGKVGGTTIVAAMIQNGQLYWFSAGDSRLYIYRAGALLQVTRDHNYRLRLDELKKMDKISDMQYEKEKTHWEELISYLGLGNLELYDLTLSGVNVVPGDVILLATDGLYKILDGVEIQKVLRSAQTGHEAANTLIDRVREKQEILGRDNATAAVIQI